MENPIKMDDLGVPLFLETPASVSNDVTPKPANPSFIELQAQTCSKELVPQDILIFLFLCLFSVPCSVLSSFELYTSIKVPNPRLIAQWNTNGCTSRTNMLEGCSSLSNISMATPKSHHPIDSYRAPCWQASCLRQLVNQLPSIDGIQQIDISRPGSIEKDVFKGSRLSIKSKHQED